MEKFEEIKGVIRSRNSKRKKRQYNLKVKKDKSRLSFSHLRLLITPLVSSYSNEDITDTSSVSKTLVKW